MDTKVSGHGDGWYFWLPLLWSSPLFFYTLSSFNFANSVQTGDLTPFPLSVRILHERESALFTEDEQGMIQIMHISNLQDRPSCTRGRDTHPSCTRGRDTHPSGISLKLEFMFIYFSSLILTHIIIEILLFLIVSSYTISCTIFTLS